MADVDVREGTPSSLHPPKRIMRIRSPSPSGPRDRSQTPARGRSVTPLMRFREKSCPPGEQLTWRSITPFIQREDKDKITPLEIGTNIILQLASNKAIIDKALVCDISFGEEPPARYIISEQSVIDKAAVMDLSNVEIIYVEDDDFEDSDFRESETPESTAATEDVKEPSGSDDEAKEDKKKKKKAKKPVKKKEKKEKEDTPPKLKLDLGPPASKVNKSKLFQQKEAALPAKPPPKRGKLPGALAAKEEEAKAAAEAERLAEEERKRQEEEEEEEARRLAEEEAENEHGSDDEQRGTKAPNFFVHFISIH